MREEAAVRPFRTDAVVVLPDHLHAVWTLPPGDAAFDLRWAAIKSAFTRAFLEAGGREAPASAGKKRKGYRGVWQPRFIEHTLRDDEDFVQHVNYIHWNPVKHGHARCPKDWPWSSFHRCVRAGDYPPNWGCQDRPPPNFPTIDEDLLEGHLP